MLSGRRLSSAAEPRYGTGNVFIDSLNDSPNASAPNITLARRIALQMTTDAAHAATPRRRLSRMYAVIKIDT